MAGTDSTRTNTDHLEQNAPAIILSHPQLGENIGMVARAMLNCGLTDLRLVNPRDEWPNEAAVKACSGATVVLDNARVFSCTEEAIADLNKVYATTARSRDMTKDVYTPNGAIKETRSFLANGAQCGFLMGREAKGLNNDDIALADAIVQVPLNPSFSSLNLAQAVLVMGYEWYQSGDVTPDKEFTFPEDTRLANKQELVYLFEHLESELDETGFLYPPEKRPVMVRNIRNIFQRANLTEQEVRTLRGVIKKLSRKA